MAEDARRHLKTLGLEPGASLADVKHAYRELARVWHPDQFANAPHLRDVAQTKMAEINTAYQYLKRVLPETGNAGAGASAHAAPSAPSSPPSSSASTRDAYAHNKWRTDYTTHSRSASTADSANTNATRPTVPLLSIVHALHDPWQPVTDVAFSPDGRWLLGTSGASVFWWNVETGETVRELRMEKGACAGLGIAPGGDVMAFANNSTGWLGRQRSEVRLCDVQTGDVRQCWKQDGHVTSLAWSGDGKQIVTGSTNNRVYFRDADGERDVQPLLPQESAGEAEVRRVAYVAGPYAAKQVVVLRIGPIVSEIGLWEVRRARLLKEYSLHVRECLTYGQVAEVLPSPDGGLLLVANNDPAKRNYTLALWDTQTGAEVRTFRGHEAAIVGLAWSADGKQIASCGADKTVRVWNAANGTEQARGLGHTRTVRAVAFASNGKFLATGGDDRAVCVWRLGSRQ